MTAILGAIFSKVSAFDLTQCALAIIAVFTTAALLLTGHQLLPEWTTIVGLIVGHYFGNRAGASPPDLPPPPPTAVLLVPEAIVK